MKADREHRAPLSESAIFLLRRMECKKSSNAIFPGQQKDHLSNMALLFVLKRMGRTGITTHGFRSSFRDWVSECTDTPREDAEMALAYSAGNAVEADDRRGDLLEKRRLLMGKWSEYCGFGGDNNFITIADSKNAQKTLCEWIGSDEQCPCRPYCRSTSEGRYRAEAFSSCVKAPKEPPCGYLHRLYLCLSIVHPDNSRVRIKLQINLINTINWCSTYG